MGINADNSAPSSNAMLDIKSSTKGLLIPRVGADLASPTEGLLYYNTTGHNFRYYDGTAWQNALFGNQWNVNETDISYSLGKVGIGTTTPIALLNIFNATNSSLSFNNNASGATVYDGFSIGTDGTLSGYLWNKENAPIRIGTNDTERVTITSAGNVGIGYNGPNYKLSVNGISYTNGIYINGTTTSEGSITVNDVSNLNGTVNINGGTSNLNVDGNITTNNGKGIVRSHTSTQLVIIPFNTGNSLGWTLNPGAIACCINMSFAAFTSPPSIAFGRFTGGTVTNPENLALTIKSVTTTSAQILITNIGTTNSTGTNTSLDAMIIGPK